MSNYHCPCCCDTCDRGYIRDAVYDEETNQVVPVDYLCAHRLPGARLCTRCTNARCDSVLGALCVDSTVYTYEGDES